MNGCVEKLTTSILQIERLSNHQNQLLTQAIDATKDLNPRDAVFLASEVSSDFESLLLQSRAALDRLTNFIFLEIVATIRSILSTAEKILQSSKKDEKTESVLKIIDDAKWFEGKLIEDNSQSNLRSSVAHKQSISERLENTFQVPYLSRDQVLIYDMDSKGVPFFNTAHEMGKNLSYVTLNMLALFTTRQIFDPNLLQPRLEK
jgi:hypothetical protein